MSSVTGIGLFSSGLYLDLGSPTDLSVSSISGWVTQPQTIGKLNSYISTCFQPTGYTGAGSWNNDVTPDLGNEEYAILAAMYNVSYYNQLVRKLAGAGGTQRILQSTSEGDSKVTFVSNADLARIYIDNAKEATKTLNYLVNNYNVNIAENSAPRSVDHYTIAPPFSVDWRYRGRY